MVYSWLHFLCEVIGLSHLIWMKELFAYPGTKCHNYCCFRNVRFRQVSSTQITSWVASFPGSPFRILSRTFGSPFWILSRTSPFWILSRTKGARQNPERRAWERGYIQSTPLVLFQFYYLTIRKMSERYIVRYLKFEFGAACKCRTYAKKSQVICSSSALVSYAFFAIRRCKVNVHDITAIVYTVRQIAAGRS